MPVEKDLKEVDRNFEISKPAQTNKASSLIGSLLFFLNTSRLMCVLVMLCWERLHLLCTFELHFAQTVYKFHSSVYPTLLYMYKNCLDMHHILKRIYIWF